MERENKYIEVVAKKVEFYIIRFQDPSILEITYPNPPFQSFLSH